MFLGLESYPFTLLGCVELSAAGVCLWWSTLELATTARQIDLCLSVPCLSWIFSSLTGVFGWNITLASYYCTGCKSSSVRTLFISGGADVSSLHTDARLSVSRLSVILLQF